MKNKIAFSNCCSAPMDTDKKICCDCKEPCEVGFYEDEKVKTGLNKLSELLVIMEKLTATYFGIDQRKVTANWDGKEIKIEIRK